MAPDMPNQFGEYTVAEIARHVADLRATSASRRSRSLRTARLLMSQLVARVQARLRANAGSRPTEPARSPAVPLSR